MEQLLSGLARPARLPVMFFVLLLLASAAKPHVDDPRFVLDSTDAFFVGTCFYSGFEIPGSCYEVRREYFGKCFQKMIEKAC